MASASDKVFQEDFSDVGDGWLNLLGADIGGSLRRGGAEEVEPRTVILQKKGTFAVQDIVTGVPRLFSAFVGFGKPQAKAEGNEFPVASITDEALPQGEEEMSLKEIRVNGGGPVGEIAFIHAHGSQQASCCVAEGDFEPFVLEEGEFIVSVSGYQVLRLDAVKFTTNRGRSSLLYGDETGSAWFEMQASPWCQVWGLARAKGASGTIASLVERPAPSVYIVNAERIGGGWWGAAPRGNQAVALTSSTRQQIQARPSQQESVDSQTQPVTGGSGQSWDEMRGVISPWLNAGESVGGYQMVAARVNLFEVSDSSKMAHFQRGLRHRRGERQRWTLC
eukprot:TRINITY_DN13712_c1_g1_i2.p1 TRINITY_DN13712_c1_g1~~TRINITY_DN13712_c1_g1_i2.p1  ORF type:complete len:381 (+),score=71.95 TRINITY_DN13712_c1_g1_i2:141-1145(+)